MITIKKIFIHLGHVIKHGGLCYVIYLIKMSIYPHFFCLFNKYISPKKIQKIFQRSFVVISLSLLFISLVLHKWWSYYTLAVIAAIGLVYLLIRSVIWVMLFSKVLKLMGSRHPGLFTRWESWQVSPETRQAVLTFQLQNHDEELILGSIDNEGRLLSRVGALPGWKNITPDEFISRYHFPMDLVLIDNSVLIKKYFKGNFKKFFTEWINLVVLSRTSNVPVVFKVDIGRTILYKNMIVGRTIRDILAEAGAKILNIQTDNDPDLRKLTRSERTKIILKRGTDKLSDCLDSDCMKNLEKQLNIIHAQGFARLSLTFGNIMIDDFDQPWFIDLESSAHFSSLDDPVFIWERDQDREKFNMIYDQQILTIDKAHTYIKELEKLGAGKYAPIDFGYGLTLGKYWMVDSGTGRWDFLNKKVLSTIIAEKRILDLGSNNGVLPLMMIRSGAKEVIGLEMDSQMVNNASRIKEIMEWRDLKTYNFNIIEKDMCAILTEDFGPLDMITAFCSLYYLSEDDMVKVVKKASSLVPMIILQAKVDTRSDATMNKAEKSSLQFLENILRSNGFPLVKVFAPRGYSRPIIIGVREYDFLQVH